MTFIHRVIGTGAAVAAVAASAAVPASAQPQGRTLQQLQVSTNTAAGSGFCGTSPQVTPKNGYYVTWTFIGHWTEGVLKTDHVHAWRSNEGQYYYKHWCPIDF